MFLTSAIPPQFVFLTGPISFISSFNPFLVCGLIYIGWVQTTDDLLNIGLDKNNLANDYMFYNIGSGFSFSVKNIIELIEEIIGRTLQIEERIAELSQNSQFI